MVKERAEKSIELAKKVDLMLGLEVNSVAGTSAPMETLKAIKSSLSREELRGSQRGN